LVLDVGFALRVSVRFRVRANPNPRLLVFGCRARVIVKSQGLQSQVRAPKTLLGSWFFIVCVGAAEKCVSVAL